MGKIYDALEKVGETQKLKVVSRARPPARKSKAMSIGAMGAEPGREKQRGGVPQIDPNLVVYHDPASMEAEIFKILRNNILFPKEGEPPPSIMVTSAVPGDGKSFVAANLAISIAQGVAEHVLLMDCDMRRSSIHRQFGFDDNVPGLSEYLSNGVDLPSLLKKTVVDKLTILPGGSTPANPSELLSSQGMKLLLEQSKKPLQ
jgi:protein-tyrosine kinase